MTTSMKRKQLELLLNDFELLSKTTLLQLKIVSKLLQDNSIVALFEEAKSNEIIIDRLEVKVREEVVFSIFQFNPKAADLRQIIAYQDLTTNMERVGDMLLNIVEFLMEMDLKKSELKSVLKLIDKQLEYVSEMLQGSILSFANEDTQTAYQIIKDDDKVDEVYRQITLSLQETFQSKQLTQEDIKHLLNLSAISYNLERIGDSATNIAEATIYLTDGKDVRHGNK